MLLAIANGSVPDADALTEVNYDPPTSRVRAFSFTTSSGKWLERRGRVSVSLGVADDLRNEMTAVGAWKMSRLPKVRRSNEGTREREMPDGLTILACQTIERRVGWGIPEIASW